MKSSLLMNRALEFHDSVVAEVAAANGPLVLSFRDAYVHVSGGTPGVDAGDGYLQPIDLTFSRASWTGALSHAPGAISDGNFRLDGKSLGLLRLPCSIVGSIEIDFVFTSGMALSIRAHEATSSSRGPRAGLKATRAIGVLRGRNSRRYRCAAQQWDGADAGR
jgi:hypothetical protein